MSETAAAALARLYDLDLADDPGDADLLLALAARAGGPVLELAAGSGRLLLPLAAAGHAVTGVDLDPAMLDRARAGAAAAGGKVTRRVTLVEGDARVVRLDDAGRFRLAFIALNSIFLMGPRADQAAAVSTLAAHLAPGGLALVDAWLPDVADFATYDGRLTLEWVREDPASGCSVAKTSSARYDASQASVLLTTIFEEGRSGEPAARWIREDRLHLVTPADLVAFAEAAGLVVDTIAGDHGLGDLGPGSDRVVLLAHRP